MKTGRRGPRVTQPGNDENRVNEFRVEADFTLAELSDAIGINAPNISQLISGMSAPYYLRGKKTGEVKPWVERLAVLFNSDVYELFPRYFCKLTDPEPVRLKPDTFAGNCIGEYTMARSQSPSKQYDKAELRDRIRRILGTLPQRIEQILILRFFIGRTLDEVSELYGVGRERIRQLESKGLRKLKHKTRSRFLAEFYN